MVSLIQKWFKKSGEDFITIVSGLPRSGTSMMMQMLEAGGMVILTDHIRKADDDNPRGYYELEKVKKIKEDSSWLKDAYGRAFKMVSALLFYLPEGHRYKVIFMRRNLEEMLRSQKVMLQRLGKKGADLTDEELIPKLEEHLMDVERWLGTQKRIQAVHIQYSRILRDPKGSAGLVNGLLDGRLDLDKMAGVVDPSLYNQRVSQQRKLGNP
jgi:hypothetical protein